MKIRLTITLFATLLIAGCSGSEGESSDASSTASTPGTTAPRTATPSSLTDPASGGDLVGGWTADASEILAANTVNVGGAGAVACTGPIVMTFSADGSFDRSGTITCAIADMSFTGTLSSVGRWESAGSTVIISETTTSGTMLMGGVEIPVPDSFGDGTGEYSVVGDVLTMTFTIAPVGTVVQTYARVG